MQIICFSKDRPFLLTHFLASSTTDSAPDSRAPPLNLPRIDVNNSSDWSIFPAKSPFSPCAACEQVWLAARLRTLAKDKAAHDGRLFVDKLYQTEKGRRPRSKDLPGPHHHLDSFGTICGFEAHETCGQTKFLCPLLTLGRAAYIHSRLGLIMGCGRVPDNSQRNYQLLPSLFRFLRLVGSQPVRSLGGTSSRPRSPCCPRLFLYLHSLYTWFVLTRVDPHSTFSC